MSRKDRDKRVGGLKRNNKSKKVIDESATVDMLNLPPRSKTIQKKEDERRPWWKIKYPLITALVFLFILLPIGVVLLVQYKYVGIFSNKSSLFIPSNKFEKVKITSTGDKDQLQDDQTTKVENQKPAETNENKDNQIPVPDESVGVKEIKHVVKEGETLFTISMKYYNNRNGEEIIQDENNLKDIEVKPGQVLKIPLNVDLNK